MLVSNMGQGGEVGLDIHRGSLDRLQRSASTHRKAKKRRMTGTSKGDKGSVVHTSQPDNSTYLGGITNVLIGFIYWKMF